MPGILACGSAQLVAEMPCVALKAFLGGGPGQGAVFFCISLPLQIDQEPRRSGCLPAGDVKKSVFQMFLVTKDPLSFALSSAPRVVFLKLMGACVLTFQKWGFRILTPQCIEVGPHLELF